MGDFFVVDGEEPDANCIWMDCDSPAIAVLGCSKKTIKMGLCAAHAEQFLNAEIVPTDNDEVISVSIAGTIDRSEVVDE